MPRDFEIFQEFAETGITYLINRLRRKFKDSFLILIVYGSYATREYQVGSDVDCIAIMRSSIINGTNVSHWTQRLIFETYLHLKKKGAFRALATKSPQININTISQRTFRKKLAENDPMVLDMLYFGNVYYPEKEKALEFFKDTRKPLSKHKYLDLTFNEEVLHFLKLYVRQFLKKCLLLGRRLYLVQQEEQVTKSRIIHLFDEEFPTISTHISLEELSFYLNDDFEKLSIDDLIKIISKCNKFILLAEKYARRFL